MITTNQWAAILAGGDGMRLQALTTAVAGDQRPKQYCKLLGGTRTLLDETRERMGQIVPPDRTVFVVTAAHEPYYSSALSGVPSWNVFAQPSNRGTLAAVAFTLARLKAAGVDGIVGFFPSDHYYRDTRLFCQAVSMAYWQANRRRDRVVLLGAEATHAETDYGWIEPGAVLGHQRHAAGCHWPLRVVERFVEKPTAAVAESMLSRGCLWNTLVVIGHVDALIGLIEATNPQMAGTMPAFANAPVSAGDDCALAEVYRTVRRADFSSDALAAAPERLYVMTVPHLGWTDLGRPERVVDVLAERHQVLTASHMIS
jgi:mannose-1-phosphate guanylyltransferase